MTERATLHAVIHGKVQGVFFRAFILEKARSHGITGYARNLPSPEDLEIQAEGTREELEKLVEHLKIGPTGARVEKVTTVWSAYEGKYTRFDIRY